MDQSIQPTVEHENISRRGFLGMMGLTGMAAFTMGGLSPVVKVGEGGVAYADEDAETLNEAWDNAWSGPGSGDNCWLGTPEEIEALGGSTMPLTEVNRRRQLYVDTQVPHTNEDGTEVPEVFVKVRALLNTYGYGIGNALTDHVFTCIMNDMTEEAAQAYLDMPWDQRFTTYDFMAKSGYSLEDCEQFCDELYHAGWLYRQETDGGVKWSHVPFSMQMAMYHLPNVLTDLGKSAMFHDMFADDMYPLVYQQAGTPWLVPAPATADIVKEGDLLPYDNLRELLKSKNKFAVSPCFCKGVFLQFPQEMGGAGQPFPEGYPEDKSGLADLTYPSSWDGPDPHIETCLSTGDEAQAIIDLGAGREITYEEAVEFLDRAVDEGLVLERAFSKGAESICCCDRDCCMVLLAWKMLAGQGEDFEANRTFQQVSHYMLEVDHDKCIKCGICVNRCPLDAISMDGEDGFPQMAGQCIHCGQCAYICPQQARQLVARPAEEILEMPNTIFDEANEKAGERFEHGLIY